MADRAPEIWVFRHGETDWSRAGRHTGRTDVPLNARGEAQGAALGRWLAGRQFGTVLTSPLTRARETCRLAGYGDQAEEVEDLAEWDYGAVEGHTSAELRLAQPDWTIWYADTRNGETVDDVSRRARRVLDRCEAVGWDVALFAHGHLLRILAAAWLGLPPRAGQLFALDAGGAGVLGYEHGARVLRGWNLGPRADAPPGS